MPIVTITWPVPDPAGKIAYCLELECDINPGSPGLPRDSQHGGTPGEPPRMEDVWPVGCKTIRVKSGELWESYALSPEEEREYLEFFNGYGMGMICENKDAIEAAAVARYTDTAPLLEA